MCVRENVCVRDRKKREIDKGNRNQIGKKGREKKTDPGEILEKETPASKEKASV